MNKNEFLDFIKKGAIKSWESEKILPSLIGAQAILESGWGKSDLAQKANNLFGVKSSNDWTGETVDHLTKEYENGKFVDKIEKFRKYKTMSDSVTDHALFFSSTEWRKNNYQHVFGETDYTKAVNAILSPIAPSGYATDNTYATKIIQIIEENNLNEWDKEIIGKDDENMAKGDLVIIDAGHGGSDGGSSGNGLTEKTWVLDVSKKTEKYLKEMGFKVKMTRSSDVFVGLSERANIANKAGGKIFVSVHFNAFGDPSANGYEDFIYNGAINSATTSLQTKVHEKVSAFTTKQGLFNRGKKRANYAVLRESNMPAILVEAGFCSNPKDAKAMGTNTFKDGFARALAEGIKAQLGGGGNISTTPEKPVDKPNSISGNNYVMKKGDTLYSVAKASGVTVQNLMAWNSITDPANIPVGTRLTIKNGTTIHTVVKGDTLWGIATKYGTTVADLASSNGIGVNSTLKIGKKIKVNGTENIIAGGGKPSSSLITYVVKAGDNLSTIAQKYGTTSQAIAKANGISNLNLIGVGTKLVFSGKQSSTPSPAPLKVYTVKYGDTLSQIAVNLKVSEAHLVKTNAIKDKNKLSVGQKLKY